MFKNLICEDFYGPHDVARSYLLREIEELLKSFFFTRNLEIKIMAIQAFQDGTLLTRAIFLEGRYEFHLEFSIMGKLFTIKHQCKSDKSKCPSKFLAGDMDIFAELVCEMSANGFIYVDRDRFIESMYQGYIHDGSGNEVKRISCYDRYFSAYASQGF